MKTEQTEVTYLRQLARNNDTPFIGEDKDVVTITSVLHSDQYIGLLLPEVFDPEDPHYLDQVKIASEWIANESLWKVHLKLDEAPLSISISIAEEGYRLYFIESARFGPVCLDVILRNFQMSLSNLSLTIPSKPTTPIRVDYVSHNTSHPESDLIRYLKDYRQLHEIYGPDYNLTLKNPTLRYRHATSEQEPQPVLDSLRKGDLGLVVGPSGIGKTWALLELGLSVSGGTDAFHNTFQAPSFGTAAAFFMEDDYEMIEERTQAIKARDNLPELPFATVCRDTFTRMRGNSPREKQKIIENGLEAINKSLPIPLKLIIIDPLKEIIEGSENNDSDVIEAMNWLRFLAGKYNCAVLVGHHTSEASQRQLYGAGGGLDQMAVRGHSSISGSSRWTLNLSPASKKITEPRVLFKTTKASYGPVMHTPIIMQLGNQEGTPLKDKEQPAGFILAPEPITIAPPKPKPEDELNSILLAIQGIPHPMVKDDTERKAREATGLSRSTVRQHLNTLIDRGSIELIKDGRKRLLAVRQKSE